MESKKKKSAKGKESEKIAFNLGSHKLLYLGIILMKLTSFP